MPQQLHVIDAMVTESSIAVRWIPGFDGGEEQLFVIGYKKSADVTWTYINVSSTLNRFSIGKLVAGTKYDIKVYACNTIGKSDETSVLSVITKSASSGMY
ncbi:hypothetical protein DPMN_139792 [Dreissena polymorpha]|uniref:Fibronectin type-III domain-containing protein n=1 Tax=Dreissena polymorpha TaxID=45954 RepID=A0A9D4G6I3_DREPO|nr:hypothetical protein DPMN_139792 [Dreissena polymorpha]